MPSGYSTPRSLGHLRLVYIHLHKDCSLRAGGRCPEQNDVRG